jgi:hypothetical protein
MNELKEFIIDKIISYRKEEHELFFNEDSILEASDVDLEKIILYHGIIEGLYIALNKLKLIEKK